MYVNIDCQIKTKKVLPHSLTPTLFILITILIQQMVELYNLKVLGFIKQITIFYVHCFRSVSSLLFFDRLILSILEYGIVVWYQRWITPPPINIISLCFFHCNAVVDFVDIHISRVTEFYTHVYCKHCKVTIQKSPASLLISHK